MKVLVTGANGFLGSHVVRILLEQGFDVKAFILNGTSEGNLEGLAYEPFYGDLLQLEDIFQALESCDYVIHAAGITDVWPTKNPFSWEINYKVVKYLANAIEQQPIKRFVHIGTASSFGYGTIANPGTEESECKCGRYGLDYIDSKKAAQDFLLEEATNNHLPVIIINPTFMIGEHDSQIGTGEMILSVINGDVPGYAAGGRCFAAVKDVAKACVNALTLGTIGECYITGGTNLCYKDFFELVAEIGGVKPLKLKIPGWLEIGVAAILEFIAKIRKKKPKLTVAMAKISIDGHYFSSQKAMRELDFPQSELKTAIQEAISWYGKHGYIKRGRSS